ncbi:MAG: hypothetical protein FWH17_10870 [Oscillospiraceae bacterium]|nr:hypothetical protein [Oscillospiraceae bacterium]
MYYFYTINAKASAFKSATLCSPSRLIKVRRENPQSAANPEALTSPDFP